MSVIQQTFKAAKCSTNCLRLSQLAPSRRLLSSSRSTRQDQPPSEGEQPAASGSQQTLDEKPSDSEAPLDPEPSSTSSKAAQENGFRAWLNGDGAKFRKPVSGRTNWIGQTPFPLNPSFHPQPPLPDVIKTKIYNAYTINLMSSETATDSVVVRAVSQKFGVGMDRVRAIIRLKELERKWKNEGRTLQTELLKGMESHLGVKQPMGENWKGIEAPEPESDTVISKKRTIFEMVDTEAGDEPVFLPLVARAIQAGSTSPDSAAKTSQSRRRELVVLASRPGRAATVFRDVSGSSEGKVWEGTRKEQTRRGNRKPVVTGADEGAKGSVASQPSA